MHRAGGLAFFDYATAAPYVKVNSLYLPFTSLVEYLQFPVTKSFSFLQHYVAA